MKQATQNWLEEKYRYLDRFSSYPYEDNTSQAGNITLYQADDGEVADGVFIESGTLSWNRQHSTEGAAGQQTKLQERELASGGGALERQATVLAKTTPTHVVTLKRVNTRSEKEPDIEGVRVIDHKTNHNKILNLKRNLYGYNHAYLTNK